MCQTYPARAIRLIVPFPSGAGADMLARVIAQRLSEGLGQPMQIDNKPGAEGSIAVAAAAAAPPDGYTIIVSDFLSVVHNTADPTTSLAPVGTIGTSPRVLIVASGVAAKSVKELIALLQAKPGQLKFASRGAGGLSHLAGELFMLQTQTRMIHVPYNGSASALNDLRAGRADISFPALRTGFSHVKSGHVRALATTGARRSEMMPDTPTVAESGVAGYEVAISYGALAPARTPPPVIERLNRELVKAIERPALRELLLKYGVGPLGLTPESFAAQLKREAATWTKVNRAMGTASACGSGACNCSDGMCRPACCKSYDRARPESRTTGSNAQAAFHYTGRKLRRNNVLPDVTARSPERRAAALGASPQECAANAYMLFYSTPCEKRKKAKAGYGKKKKGIKPECAYAAENLRICTCAQAAQDLISKPCSKKLDSPECTAAVTDLHTCTAAAPLSGR